MELRYLKYFVTVAERQNFTRAAEQLHVAQPAISQQIKSLEGELGVSLLHRTKRSVKLTAAGHAFLPEAKQILAHAELSKQIARRAARGETGSLAIGCVSASVSGFLPELIQSYPSSTVREPVLKNFREFPRNSASRAGAISKCSAKFC